MITGDIKQKVDAVWQTFWNKGFTNTSAIFEQITYLLFMKMLDDKQLEKEAIANLMAISCLTLRFQMVCGTIRLPTKMCHTMKCVGTYSRKWSRQRC